MRSDPERLETLRRLMLLDSQPEHDYDFKPRTVADDALDNMRILAASVIELMVNRHQQQPSGTGSR
jgi:hypothetical protein